VLTLTRPAEADRSVATASRTINDSPGVSIASDVRTRTFFDGAADA
jgi:hypothetical protein